MNSKVMTAIGTGIGVVVGVLIEKYHNKMNTPEETIQKLNAATLENKAAAKELAKVKSDDEKVLSEIKKTKQAYQDEIRPELEAKIRKELESYISKADAVYEKARHENELASLKLELVDQKKRNDLAKAVTDGVSRIYIDL